MPHDDDLPPLPSTRRLRALALLEGISLATLLFVAVPLKHLAGLPGAVTVLGPLHGLLFLAYSWALVEATSAGALRPRQAVRLWAWSWAPFGAFARLRRGAR
jgi:integral membrane protein